MSTVRRVVAPRAQNPRRSPYSDFARPLLSRALTETATRGVWRGQATLFVAACRPDYFAHNAFKTAARALPRSSFLSGSCSAISAARRGDARHRADHLDGRFVGAIVVEIAGVARLSRVRQAIRPLALDEQTGFAGPLVGAPPHSRPPTSCRPRNGAVPGSWHRRARRVRRPTRHQKQEFHFDL